MGGEVGRGGRGREGQRGGRERGREGEAGRQGGRADRERGREVRARAPPSLARAPPSPPRFIPPTLRPSRSSGSLPPVLPHCLLYFLKLYNVFNDNVQSIRYILWDYVANQTANIT